MIGRLTQLFIVGLLILAGTGSATANTKAEDWKLTTSIKSESQDTATNWGINIRRCRALLDNPDTEVRFEVTLGKGRPGQEAQYSVKMARGNEKCNKESLDKEADDACESIVNKQNLTSGLVYKFTKTSKELSSIKNKDECSDRDETTYIYVIVKERNTLTTQFNTYAQSFLFHFKTKRPQAPTNVAARGGSASIQMAWDTVNDSRSYNVYYATSDHSLSEGQVPENLSGFRSVNVAKSKTTVKDKIEAEKEYILAVTAVDAQGNESLLSKTVTAKTVSSKDFWQSHREEFADVDGGFCFIATAAWGSPQEPHVGVLRKFRDDILRKSAAGRAFIDFYYRVSPPLAVLIAQNAGLRAVTRVALYPLYAASVVMLYGHPLAVFVFFAALLALILFPFRKRLSAFARSRKTTHTALILATLSAALFASPSLHAAESDVDMMFELKAGPYKPGKLGKAYKKHFGDKSGFLVEGEFDWQFWRGIGGSFAIGMNLAYGNIDGKALTEDESQKIDSTSLSWMPLRLALVYRMDTLWTQFDFPLTLYGKFGLDYAFWWIKDGSDSVSESKDKKKGRGGTFGWHAVGGIAFVLDWLTPDMARSFDVEWGVNNSYIFAEFLYSRLDGFGSKKAFNLSDYATFQIGLALEF